MDSILFKSSNRQEPVGKEATVIPRPDLGSLGSWIESTGERAGHSPP